MVPTFAGRQHVQGSFPSIPPRADVAPGSGAPLHELLHSSASCSPQLRCPACWQIGPGCVAPGSTLVVDCVSQGGTSAGKPRKILDRQAGQHLPSDNPLQAVRGEAGCAWAHNRAHLDRSSSRQDSRGISQISSCGQHSSSTTAATSEQRCASFEQGRKASISESHYIVSEVNSRLAGHQLGTAVLHISAVREN